MQRWADLNRAARAPGADLVVLAAAMARIVPEALRHPPEPRILSPLPPDAVGAGEVVALLRRALAGEARLRMVAPPLRWRDVHHSLGEVVIEGWRLVFFRRGYGARHLDAVVAPDGRRSTDTLLSAREGDPYALLEDDEQDRLDAIVEDLVADGDAG